jgi:hypothetical protein
MLYILIMSAVAIVITNLTSILIAKKDLSNCKIYLKSIFWFIIILSIVEILPFILFEDIMNFILYR